MLWESLCSGSHYALGVIMLWESLCSGSHDALGVHYALGVIMLWESIMLCCDLATLWGVYIAHISK